MGNTCSGSAQATNRAVVIENRKMVDVGVEIPQQRPPSPAPAGSTSRGAKININHTGPANYGSTSSKGGEVSKVIPAGVRTSTTIVPVKQNSGPTIFSCNDYSNGIDKMENLSANYEWIADVFVAKTRQQLKDKVVECQENGKSLRVKGSGWSCNKFLDPSKSDGDKDGVQIILAGDFNSVIAVDEPVGTVTAGAATQRQAIYSKLNESGRQLKCSGECFTSTASQEVGGLIANAVHDTMQESFSPETVHSLEALVFDENKKPKIRSFCADDGDDFYAFFGGMGMTGIIVSAKLKCIDKKYYHYRPYLPGSDYDDDESFKVGNKAKTIGELTKDHDIKSQESNCTLDGFRPLSVDTTGGLMTYKSSFPNALKDLCLKHKCDKDDVCAMFYLFPTPAEEKEALAKTRVMADGNVTVQGLGRYWKRTTEQKPPFTVAQDIYNDISPLMGKEYLQDERTIDALMPSLTEVQDSVANTKWKYANLMNHTTKDSSPVEVQNAIADSSRHWAYCESGVAHTTGPNYIYLWERATEFYVKEEDIDAFAKILQPAVVAMIKSAIGSGTSSNAGGASIFADCRYALSSETAFMSGWYKKDHLAVDIGCTKFHFTNAQYTKMTTTVLEECKRQGIDIKIHTGKFYVYDESFTHHMYKKGIRERFGKVVSKHDPYGIFAPQRWRKLFTAGCDPILPPPELSCRHKGEDNCIENGSGLPTIPAPLSLPFYYSSLSNFGAYYSVPIERVKPYLENSGLVPAVIEGMALVSFNFQLYTGHFNTSLGDGPDKWPGTGASITQEVELCIVSVPEGKESEVPTITFEQFVLGEEQTKIMGNKRVHVPCDSDIAIEAGITLFGEPKFKTTFKVNLASRNPTRRPGSGPYSPIWSSDWGFQIIDPDDPSKSICTCTSNLSGATSVPANFSPITEYGYHDNKLIGCRWNILQPMDTYFLPSHSACVNLSFGQSDHQMKKDMETLIGGVSPRAVRTFNSPAAAVQSRAFYP